jgi:mono/diheme cytochrome c family protein
LFADDFGPCRREALRVMSGLFSPRGLSFVLAGPLLALFLIGCREAYYSENLRYPLRTDPIVADRPPKEDIVYPTSLGKLDQSLLANIGEDKHGGRLLHPKDLSETDRAELRDALEKVFGTPANPKVEVSDYSGQLEGASKKLAGLKLDADTLGRGSIEYRWQCLHCHGLAGDGRGPTGPWVVPHPRDYRQGAFKFVSSSLELDPRARKPRRADLHRTIEKGIEGTSMPAFNQMTPHHTDQIVSYVIHLSIRGQVEFETMKSLLANKGDKMKLTVAEEGGDQSPTIEKNVKFLAARFVSQWSEADTATPNTPPPYSYTPDQLGKDAGELETQAAALEAKAEAAPMEAEKRQAEAATKKKEAEKEEDAKKARALRTRAAELEKEAAALLAGVADLQKQAAALRDGSRIKKTQAERLKSGDSEAGRAIQLGSIVRGYHLFADANGKAACIKCHDDFGRQVRFRYDVWGTLVRPANLTNPTYRGGRRPIDIYWRISGGIDPSGMNKANISPQETWDVINFVQALPYPRMLPGREEVSRYARFKDEKITNIRERIYIVEGKKEEHSGGH